MSEGNESKTNSRRGNHRFLVRSKSKWLEVEIGIEKGKEFEYLASTVQKNGVCGREVKNAC